GWDGHREWFKGSDGVWCCRWGCGGGASFGGDEIPGAPSLDGGLEGVCGECVVCAEEVYEVLGGEEHGSFLLRLDGAAVLLWRVQLTQLRGDGDVDVEIGDVAERDGVLVGELPARFAVRVELSAGEESDV
ncbi:hypothetical protein V492_03508, partial [Pseudogymnoascus sp. VKM F-4246]